MGLSFEKRVEGAGGLPEFLRQIKRIDEEIGRVSFRTDAWMPFRCPILGEPDVCAECSGDRCELLVHAGGIHMRLATVNLANGTITYEGPPSQHADLYERALRLVERAKEDPVGAFAEVAGRLYTAFAALARATGRREYYDIMSFIENLYFDYIGEAPVPDEGEVNRYARVYSRLLALDGVCRDAAAEATRLLSTRWPFHLAFNTMHILTCGDVTLVAMIDGNTYVPAVSGVRLIPLRASVDVLVGGTPVAHLTFDSYEPAYARLECFACADKHERAVSALEGFATRAPQLIAALVDGLPKPAAGLARVETTADALVPVGGGPTVRDVWVSGEYIRNLLKAVRRSMKETNLNSTLPEHVPLTLHYVRLRLNDKQRFREYATVFMHGTDDGLTVEVTLNDGKTTMVKVEGSLRNTGRALERSLDYRVEEAVGDVVRVPPWAAEVLAKVTTMLLNPVELAAYASKISEIACRSVGVT